MSIRSRIGEKHEVKAGKAVRGILAALLLLTGSVAAVSQGQPTAEAAPAQTQTPGPEAASPMRWW